MAGRANRKILVVDVAALGYEFLKANNALEFRGMKFQPAQSVFPAVTCSVQGSFRTASRPGQHGMISNGRFSKRLQKPMFWEQSSRLVDGTRIWEKFRGRGGKVAMLFWQQSLGEDVDFLISPAPIHTHGGGMIESFYSQPRELADRFSAAIGKRFKLSQYWGPLAKTKVGDWIAHATAMLMDDQASSPDLVLTYLPSLDYDLQRFGPGHEKSKKALAQTLAQLNILCDAAQRGGYEIVIFGDYAIADCSGQAVFPNRALANAGLFQTRTVGGRLYPDFYASRSFAMVDHEIANVYVRHSSDVEKTKLALANLDGIETVLDCRDQESAGVDHANTGELVIVAQKGKWLAYPWWTAPAKAPDYATHIDIHNKPGYDPCELFLGWPPWSVCQDTSRILGTHGRTGEGREIAVATSFDVGQPIASLLDLASIVQAKLEQP